jgi:hypothetical protein
MNYDRLRAISVEMHSLLEQQSALLKSSPVGSIAQTDMDEYHDRNQRLRELCQELTELG